MKRMVSLALLLALMALCLSGCSLFDKLFRDQPEPETTAQARQSVEQMVARCTTACNDLDLEGILDYVTPKYADPARAMLKVSTALGGKSDMELLDDLVKLLGADAETSDAWQVCQSLETEVTSLEVDGDEATARLHFTFTQDAQDYVGETTVSCTCIDGKWYITNLSR